MMDGLVILRTPLGADGVAGLSHGVPSCTSASISPSKAFGSNDSSAIPIALPSDFSPIVGINNLTLVGRFFNQILFLVDLDLWRIVHLL